MINPMIQPITLSEHELAEVLKRVAPTGKEYGAARICRMIASKTGVLSARINALCSVSNISDLVSKQVNPKIEDLGFYVACVKPPVKILNRYGQSSGQMLWAFYRDGAANEPIYDKDNLIDELRELKKQFPDLQDKDGSGIEDWIETLADAGMGET
jgi:hypothetical protein